MALGVLNIIFIVLGIIGIGLQGLLYMSNVKIISNKGIFILNMIFGLILAYTVFTALPSNYSTQRIIAVVVGSIGVIGMVLGFKDENLMLGKFMLSISVFGGLIQLFM